MNSSTIAYGDSSDLESINTEEPNISTTPEQQEQADQSILYQWTTAFYLIIGLLGTIGNLILIVTISWRKSLRRTHTNIYILNQSIFDLLSAILLILFPFTRHFDFYFYTLGHSIYCKIWLTRYLFWSVQVSSTYSLVTISIERLIATLQPIWYRNHYKRKHVIANIVLIWAFGPVLKCFNITSTRILNGQCLMWKFWPTPLTQTAVGIFTTLFEFPIPIVIHIYCYYRMASILLRNVTGPTPAATNAQEVEGQENNESQKNRRNFQTDKMKKNLFITLALITVFFFFCGACNQLTWVAFNMGMVGSWILNTTFYHFSVIILFANCCINPIIYLVRHEQLRASLLFMLGIRKVHPLENTTTSTIHSNK